MSPASAPLPQVKIIQVRLEPSGPAYPIRVISVDGDPWFVAKDAADAIGIRMDNALRHVLENDKGRAPVQTRGGTQQGSVVNGAGLRKMLLRSGKPEARRIQALIESDHLPRLRAAGFIKAPQPPSVVSVGEQQAPKVPESASEGATDRGAWIRQIAATMAQVTASANSPKPPPEELIQLLYTGLLKDAKQRPS